MEPGDACPDPTRLRALFDGGLAEGEEPALTGHLDGCAGCRAQLDRWASEIDVLAGRTPRIDTTRAPVLGHVLDQLKAVGAADEPGPLAPTSPELQGRGGDRTRPATTVADADDGGDGDDHPSLEFLAPTDRPEALGRIGPYEVTGQVGRGGMGIVLKAIDPALNRVVAVKVLAPALASSGLARRRFLREARAAAAVCHEHVVTIHAVDEANGLPYLVMQYVAGRSLQEKIDRTGPLEIKEILRIGMQVAAGLAAAHEQGLVHRDIKPANILLENGVERAKLTDFGLARAVDDARLTGSGTIAGTPNYMSPEQARGEPVDQRTDLFSLGSVLYAMTTGEAPFAAESTMAIIRRVSDASPRPVRALTPEAPGWLALLIDRLMAKDPNGRPQSAGEVAEILGQHLAEVQRPVAFHLPNPAAKSNGRRGARRWRVGAWTVLGIVAAVALVILVRSMIPDHPVPTRLPSPSPSPSPSVVAAPAPAPPAVPAREFHQLHVTGWELIQRGEYDRAFECFEEEIRLDPKCIYGWLGRSNVFCEKSDWPRAFADANEAIRLAPADAAVYDMRGKLQATSGKFAAAVIDCDEAVRLDPNRPYPYLHRGIAHNGLQQWDKAIADFGETLRRVPNDAWAFHHRSTSYWNKHDLDRALADADQAIRLAGRVARYHAARGRLFCWTRQPERALIDFNEAIRLEPENGGFYQDRGWAHVFQQHYDQAVADYSRALRDRPNDVTVLNDRASAYALSGHYEKAQADFAEALRGNPSLPWGLVRRAHYLHSARGDHDRAVADCDELLRIAPNYAEAYLDRGLALLARGEPGRAVADFDRVLALKQDTSPTFEGPLSARYPELYRARSEARARLDKRDDIRHSP